MDEPIRYEAADGLARITLARPEKRNALDLRMFLDLGEAAARASEDPSVRVVVLSGAGPSFCAGLDHAAMGELAALRGARFRDFVRKAQRPFLLLARMPKPTIAAVRGHALGAGFQLALACDLRVAAPDASFAMLEARFGLVPDLGGGHRLARLVGPAVAKDLVWTARRVDAEEAVRLGLVNRVSEDPANEATRLAREVIRHSPTAAALSKSLLDRAAETPLETELEREAQAQEVCVGSDDHRESVAAFLEGREPRFR